MRKTAFTTNRITQNSYIIPLLAFLTPLVVRAIPEMLVGSYAIGFDTQAFYVSNTILWRAGGIDISSYLATAPLFYTILISVTSLGVPLIITLKLISPLLLGFLGLSIYFYAYKCLCWSRVKSLAPALLGTLYFVALRISWDMLRNELGLIFLFITLIFLAKIKNFSCKKHYALLSLTLMVVVLSHQLTSVILLGIITFSVLKGLYNKDYRTNVKIIVASLPAFLFFVIIYVVSSSTAVFQDYTNNGGYLSDWLGFTSYQVMLINEVGFFLYCFLPILPIVLIGFRRFKNFQLKSWLLLTLILLLIPFAFVSPFRWILLLMYPFVFYVVEALSGLKYSKWKLCNVRIRRLVVLYLVFSTSILSFGFVFMQPENPFVYFNPNYLNYFQYQIPTSMLQNTISVKDFQDTINVMQWFKDNESSTALLLTHTVFYSWGLLTLKNDQIRHYSFADPLQAASTVSSEGNKEVFLVWWINGQGWYDQPTLPQDFQEIYHSGKIAIYRYVI